LVVVFRIRFYSYDLQYSEVVGFDSQVYSLAMQCVLTIYLASLNVLT